MPNSEAPYPWIGDGPDPSRPDQEPHLFDPTRFNHTMCSICACTEGKPWHIIPDPRTVLETTDAPAYETTAVIPRPRVIYAVFPGSDPT